MSAKHTHFSFPCPAISSKSYIATNNALNIQFTPFYQPEIISHTCAKVLISLNSLTIVTTVGKYLCTMVVIMQIWNFIAYFFAKEHSKCSLP